jgi:manganese/zinc/iron transport system permease protein
VGPLIDFLPLPYSDAVVAVGSALLGLTAGVVGVFAVLRQRSLVGDALAHATLPGVAIAFLITGARDASTLLVGAGLAGLVGAAVILGIERTGRVRPDVAIGVVLSSFFALGIVLITYIGSTGDAGQAGLQNYLFGQAAGLLERDLTVFALLALAALLVVALGYRAFKTTLFDQSFAGAAGLPVRLLELAMTALLVVAIIVGVRTVGAILMVALLIAPAVAARQLTRGLAGMLVVAGVVGAAVGVAGSLLSARWEAPTGPVITLVGLSVVLMAVAFAPRRGVLWRARRLRSDRRRVLTEAVLVDLTVALEAGPPPTERELALSTARPLRVVRRALRMLDGAGLLDRDGERIHLNETGAAAASAVLERRDLWTKWLEHGWRLELDDAREPDPTNVRGSLGDEATDRLRALAAEAPAS